MLPTQHVPVFKPIPIFKGRNSLLLLMASLSSSWLSSSNFSNITSAELQASVTWVGTSTGAFQNAIMQSPMYLSMVPIRSIITCVIGVRNLFISCVRPSGSYSSDIEVKPRTSQNIIEISFISPPSFSCSGSDANCSTSAGDKYIPKAPLTLARSASVAR